LQGYTRVTSPIRRYADLLTHHQISAVLQGKPAPFSCADIDAMIPYMRQRETEIKQLQNRSVLFWVLQFFKQNGSQSYDATVLDVAKSGDPNNSKLIADAYIPHLGFRTKCRVPNDVIPGSHLLLKPHSVDAYTVMWDATVRGHNDMSERAT